MSLGPSCHEHTRTQQQQQRKLQQQHSAALSSTRATLDSSSTRTPVVAVLVLLRTARAALEGTSMSRFPSLYYCTAKNGHGTTITQLLKRNEHERQTRARHGQAVTGTRAISSSGSSTQWHSSNTRVEKHSCVCVVAIVLLLRTARV